MKPSIYNVYNEWNFERIAGKAPPMGDRNLKKRHAFVVLVDRHETDQKNRSKCPWMSSAITSKCQTRDEAHLTLIFFASPSGNRCRLDTHRAAASTFSSSTNILSFLRIFTVSTFPYRQNRLNTRSQLTGTQSNPWTSTILLARIRQLASPDE